MRRINRGSDLKKSKIFENHDFLMIFGSWARLGLGIPPPGASGAQRPCGPACQSPRRGGASPSPAVVRDYSGVTGGGPGCPWIVLRGHGDRKATPMAAMYMI